MAFPWLWVCPIDRSAAGKFAGRAAISGEYDESGSSYFAKARHLGDNLRTLVIDDFD
jgi:hypothetical protein